MGLPEGLTATIAALPLPTMVVSPTGDVFAANAAAEQTFGATSDAAESDALGAIRAAVAKARRSGALPEPFETVDLTGATVMIRIGALCLGDIEALLVVAEPRGDVGALTEQVRLLEDDLRASRTDMDTANAELMAANEELHCANEELQARLAELRDAADASRHKDDFLAMLAHELRNPLAPILSAMQVIRRHPDNLEVDRKSVV